MKKALLIAIIALLCIACVTALGQKGFEKRDDADLVYCPRKMAESTGTDFVEISTEPNCGNALKNGQQQSESIKIKITPKPVPTVSYRASAKGKSDSPHTDTRFAFVEIIEFKETNGKPGFQPNSTEGPGDMIIKRYPLGKQDREKGFVSDMGGKKLGDFSPIKKTTTSVGSSSDEVAISYTTKMNHTAAGKGFIADIELRADTVPREVILKPTNETKPDMLLTPDAVKLTLILNKIKYNSTESTGLAVKVAFTTPDGQGNPTKKNNGEGNRPSPKNSGGDKPSPKNSDGDKPKPDTKPTRSGLEGEKKPPQPKAGKDGKVPQTPAEATKDQGLFSMGSDGAGFFSFNTYVDLDTNVTAEVYQWGPQVSLQPPSPDFNATKPLPKKPDENNDNMKKPKYQIMYFSVAEKAKSMVWDPTIGSTETANADLNDNTSSASAATFSVASIMVVAVLALFM